MGILGPKRRQYRALQEECQVFYVLCFLSDASQHLTFMGWTKLHKNHAKLDQGSTVQQSATFAEHVIPLELPFPNQKTEAQNRQQYHRRKTTQDDFSRIYHH